jgi:thymidylate synthase
MATELMWFLMGDTNIKYLVENGCNIWNGDAYKGYEKECDAYGVDPMSMEQFIQGIKNSNQDSHFIPDLTGYKLGDLGPIYGKQWRRILMPFDMMVIDQIQNLINDLKTNPDSRRLMVSAWNVAELDQMVLPPCHYGFQVYTRELSARERTALKSNGSTRLYDSIKEENYQTVDADDVMHTVCDEYNVPKRAISLMWNQRSVDTFLGLPFNIASYGLLLEMIAREVNMVPDQLIGNLGDVHLYSNHIEQAKEQISRSPFELPILKMSSGHNFRAALKNKPEEIDVNDFILINYKSHPAIKAILSN